MKPVIFAAVAIFFLFPSAWAQSPGSVPSLCKPCLFYAGDFNADDPNAQGFANGNTLLVPNRATYTAVDVPKNVGGVITGILFMNEASLSSFDPAVATYDIRVGVSDSNPGTSVASGTGSMSYAFWEESSGGPIFQTAVNLTKPFTVNPGTRYWFNMSPQCTDNNNLNCSDEQFWEVNTTQRANGLNAAAQPAYQMFSGMLGGTLGNACGGNNNPSCEWASFGLMGHR